LWVGEWPAIARRQLLEWSPYDEPPALRTREHPLELAIEKKHSEIVRLLLEAGARFDYMDIVIEKVKDKEMKELLRNRFQDLEDLGESEPEDI
jgi:hypothetical protein